MTIYALKHKKIPPTLNCENPHPRFKFADSPFYPVTKTEEWKPESGLRRAAISSFGFGGTNCHVIVEEFPENKGYIHRRKTLPLTQFQRKRYWLGKEIKTPSEKSDIPFNVTFYKDMLMKLSKGEITPGQAIKFATTK